MMLGFEKDFDDEVYEDDYYEDNFEEEELMDDDDVSDDELDGDEWDDEGEKKTYLSFACEDCDYRWEDVIIQRKDEPDAEMEVSTVCPMCGSMNITQI